MRNSKTIIVLVLLTSIFIDAKAQLSTHEKPVSFTREKELPSNFRSMVPIVTMPQLDMEKITKEDKEDKEYDMPPRFGYSHFVNFDLNNNGKWFEFPNGDKLWQLEVICPAALSVNFCYDKFWLPEGGKFFVYSKDKQHTLGAFTSRNNKGGIEDIRGFATGLVYSNDVILEYFQPREVTLDGIISIERVVHGYRYIRNGEPGFGASDSCMVNINCEEGKDWQIEKKAVALFLIGGNRVCTGSLINTTDLSQKPYLLTANHCISDWGEAGGYANWYFFSFWWDYEAPGCINPTLEPSHTEDMTTNGATIIANNPNTDFALLRLMEDPLALPNYSPYYLGWDRSGQSGDPGVCIHHPNGDVKKISTVLSQPTSAYDTICYSGYTYWKVFWKGTPNGHGVVDHGSSGSALLNSAHKVIGQLRGGYTDSCNVSGFNICGKFDVSWTGNNNVSNLRRLDCWLDSLNTGLQTMEGLLVIRTTYTMNTCQQIYGNIRITSTGQLSVQSNVELMGNSRLIVENGGILIVNAGTLSNVDLDIKPGAIIQIINGGAIETRNGFEAPIGATVEIIDGQIQ